MYAHVPRLTADVPWGWGAFDPNLLEGFWTENPKKLIKILAGQLKISPNEPKTSDCSTWGRE